MPQLDFANPLTIAQVVWMFIIFAALYLALRNWALPAVGSVIEERRAKIAGDLDGARQAKQAADQAAAEVAERSRAASSEAQAQIAQAVAQAKAEAAERSRIDTEALERQLQAAEHRIGAARRDAMGALRQVAADTTVAMIGRLTGSEPERGRAEAAVGAAAAARG